MQAVSLGGIARLRGRQLVRLQTERVFNFVGFLLGFSY